VALFNVGGEFYALDGVCPHQGGPLGKGCLSGPILTCPWHGWQFDVRSGQHQLSRTLVQPKFNVRVEGGDVLVDLES
jgi:nitrite reductase/ring-hydroxylating ferredoxin subunit